MTRPTQTVNQGGYVEQIEVAESDLEDVVRMLEIDDPETSERARHRIVSALEDLKTDRVRTVKAKTIREDRRDLNHLAKVGDPEVLSRPLRDLLDAIESLEASNPVLFARLGGEFRPQRIHEWKRELEEAEERAFVFGREIGTKTEALSARFNSEDGRGRPTDHAASSFASRLYSIWREYTGRPTSRQNPLEREKDPFGDFVEAAGKLIDPDFKGSHVARGIHEASRPESDGEK